MEVPFRITVLHPLPGVRLRLQRGQSELVLPSRESSDAISFDFTLRSEPDKTGGRPRFLGPFAQGPPSARFVYVNSGKRAGQADSCWDRRAKVQLGDVEPSLIRKAAAAPGTVIEARIEGVGRDGGPSCGTVRLVGAWRLTDF